MCATALRDVPLAVAEGEKGIPHSTLGFAARSQRLLLPTPPEERGRGCRDRCCYNPSGGQKSALALSAAEV